MMSGCGRCKLVETGNFFVFFGRLGRRQIESVECVKDGAVRQIAPRLFAGPGDIAVASGPSSDRAGASGPKVWRRDEASGPPPTQSGRAAESRSERGGSETPEELAGPVSSPGTAGAPGAARCQAGPSEGLPAEGGNGFRPVGWATGALFGEFSSLSWLLILVTLLLGSSFPKNLLEDLLMS